ncbi:NAD(P)-binding protein [Dichomitus squalens]|uniref:NAD(P)-binding protein n=1 Tax=Dichomitus squalens TaxID=114155 RepID=A0A4Q9PR72_9APHY|nr:NAD(P)-binding protein [Dichomitus squalens]
MSTALSLLYALRKLKILSRSHDRSPYHVTDIPNLSGKVALITGGTQGKGLEIAKAFASAEARVLILARDEDKPDVALLQVKQHCRAQQIFSPDVNLIQCNLANLADVRRVGDIVCEQESRIDIVVCDAGIGLQSFDVSEDGMDRHFAVSHLAHFLLINRLLPLLHRTASVHPHSDSDPPSPYRAPTRPRIVFLTSALHSVAPPDAHFISNAELSSESGSADSPLALYARAKLASVLFVKSLARHLDQHVLVLSVDPGAIHPKQPEQLSRAFGAVWGSALRVLTSPFERSVDEACLAALWAATAPELEEEWARWQGAYVSAVGVAGEGSEMARDGMREEQLWRMSESLLRTSLGEDALRPWSGW